MASSSRIPGFYRLDLASRRQTLAERTELDPDDLESLDDGGLDLATANTMIENVIGTYARPMGLGLNFVVNDVDRVIPMAVEEASVVAAASNAARMVRDGGGFRAHVTTPIMIGQVELVDVADVTMATRAIECAQDELHAMARAILPRLSSRGGGLVGIEIRTLDLPGDTATIDALTEARIKADDEALIEGDEALDHPIADPDIDREQLAAMAMTTLVVHLLVDCRDAMGANLVNSLAEGMAGRLAELAGGRIGLRILSNLADRRRVIATARVPDAALDPQGDPAAGAEVAEAITWASRFAELDPYRAATHNKGIMNGIDAVLLATGNDWRGIEAGAHAFAARSGRYQPLAIWRHRDGALYGRLEMPMAVGIVGGALHVHAGARLGLAILGVDSAGELGEAVASVGLASNLSALRALATDGIQRGHLSLHARMVALGAGATGELIDRVAAEIAALGEVKTERAKKILDCLQNCETLSVTIEESP